MAVQLNEPASTVLLVPVFPNRPIQHHGVVEYRTIGVDGSSKGISERIRRCQRIGIDACISRFVAASGVSTRSVSTGRVGEHDDGRVVAGEVRITRSVVHVSGQRVGARWDVGDFHIVRVVEIHGGPAPVPAGEVRA